MNNKKRTAMISKKTQQMINRVLDKIVKNKFIISGALAIMLVALSGLYFINKFESESSPNLQAMDDLDIVSIGIEDTDLIVPELDEEDIPTPTSSQNKSNYIEKEYKKSADSDDQNLSTNSDNKTNQAAKIDAAEFIKSLSKSKIPFKDINTVPVSKLLVNGFPVGDFKNFKTADGILKTLRNKYKEEDSKLLEVSFSENVQIEQREVHVVDFRGYDNPDLVLEFIERGTNEVRQHKVKKGENYWTIAQIYGVTPEDLEKANPETDPQAIQIDQLISLVVPKPIISVRTLESIEYKEEISYDVVYEDNASLYKGEVRTKSNGVYGEKKILANIIKENGSIVRKNVVKETVLSKPIAKVVYSGTKNPPPRMGTGVLGYPLSRRGPVTSEFLDTVGRAFPHRGIDVGISTGTRILASDGGVVVAAGWAGAYGYRVIVDHGGNVSTLYAHCSSVLVTVGQKVFKGETIAYSGNTGRSSGPHLHFEVRFNGVFQNPRNYLNF